MSSALGSPSNIPIADNVPMDVDSDSEAEKAVRELAQAQEWVRIANEAWERRREERKRLEEEEVQWVVEREAEEEAQWVAAREAEELLEMERQYQLQVSTRVLWNSNSTNFVAQKDLEASVMTPEPRWHPLLTREKR